MTFKVQRESLATAEELELLHQGSGTPKNVQSTTRLICLLDLWVD